MNSFLFSVRHKHHLLLKRIIYSTFVLALLLQGIAPALAQGPGYLPPTEGTPPQAEGWQGDDAFLTALEHQPEDPPLKLLEQANSFVELAPTHLVKLTAVPDKETGLETAVVPPDGATITFPSSQIMVIVDKGAVAADTILQIGQTQPDSEGHYFQLRAANAQDGLPVVQFARPVHFVLDLANFQSVSAPSEAVDTLSETKAPLQWTIALQDPLDLSGWHYPMMMAHNGTGLVSVSTEQLNPLIKLASIDTTHLSPDTTPPAPWRYQWKVPGVSTFSGAATFQYPITLPPGRGGLTPNIDISYSSRGVDTVVTTGMDQTPLGLGWSMNGVEISRNFVEIDINGPLHHSDKFSLVINGSSHLLFWAGGSGNVTNFYALNAPGIRIQQIYDSAAPGINSDKVYWKVQTPDGTTYRLGYTEDSETGQTLTAGTINTTGNQQAGYRTNYGALRWRVDTVTDVHGNQVQYDYGSVMCGTEAYGTLSVESCWATILQIRYNYEDLATDPLVRVSGSYGSKIDFVHWLIQNFWQSGLIDDIKIYHLDFTRPWQVINLQRGSMGYENDANSCDGDDVGPFTTYWIDWIRQEHTRETGQFYTLPKTLFAYTPLPHAPNSQCFKFSYLSEVNNGYGGRIKFTYAGDGRYDHDGTNHMMPRYGQSFYVTRTEISDGVHKDASNNLLWAATDYVFEQPCYDQMGSEEGDMGTMPGATNCRAKDAVVNYTYGFGSLAGFHRATVTTKDYDGNILSKQISEFYQNGDAPNDWPTEMGLPIYTESYDPKDDGNTLDDFKLQRQESFYTRDYVTNAFDFTYASSVVTTQYVQGDSPTTHTVNYTYGRQNNIQYGNLTHIDEEGFLGGISNRKRLVYREYYPNTTVWIVGAVARAAVFEGVAGTPINPATATPIADSRNYYDGQTSYTIPPLDDGDLTEVKRRKEASAPFTYITVQKMQYDNYGNVTHLTDGNTTNNFTITDYDDTYNLYPVSITNEANHVQDLYYYSLNMPVNSPMLNHYNLPGLLSESKDANDFSTYYGYDVFGRLGKVFRGWTEQGGNWHSPSEFYDYADYGSSVLNSTPFMVLSWHKTQDNALLFSGGGIFERQFFDGFGNLIQTQRPHTDWVDLYTGAGQEVVVDTSYNVLGQTISQSEPYFRPSYIWERDENNLIVNPYHLPDTSKNRVTMKYDAAGNTTWAEALDDGVTQNVYGSQSLYAQDANHSLRASYVDDLGNLVRVDEVQATYTDLFDNAALPDWNKSASGVSVSNGVLNLTGDGGGDYSTYVWRNTTPTYQDSATFSFRSANSSIRSNMYVEYGTFGQSSYRRWSLNTDGGMLQLDQYVGTTHSTTNLMPFKANTWYRAYLRTSASSAESFMLVVWEADNPSASAEIRLSPAGGGWYQSAWKFNVQVETAVSTLEFDNYAESNVSRTHYEYDLMGNLTKVKTPPIGTPATVYQTTMVYDALGRKTSMSDPDMGGWSYVYDNAGNLTSQTDANSQTIYFKYDSINRLTAKRLTNTGLPCSATERCLATYSYDSITGGNYGYGRRTGMIAYNPDDLNNSITNSASWKYDISGQVVQETRVVGSNSYVFQFDYTQGGLSTTITYPGNASGGQGETVTTNYWWMTGQPKTLTGRFPTNPPNTYYTYVTQADYNRASGQMTKLTLANSLMATAYSYDAAFRMTSLQTQYNGSNRFWYLPNYDKAGNITSILDATPPNGGSWQWQYFKYDSLNRLIDGYTTGGNAGQYDEAYRYDAVGNLTYNGEAVMGYGQAAEGLLGGARPHLVTHLGGSQKFGYDNNGNMTQRIDGSTSWQMNWTRENMLKQAIAGSDTVSLLYDADNQLVQRTESTESIETIVYLGKLFEHNTSLNSFKVYYLFNGQMVALREGVTSGGQVSFLVGDHLGSASVTLWANGSVRGRLRYKPWGETRYTYATTPTGYRYTSQREDSLLKLYDYNARYYDANIGRFLSADTLVPDPVNSQALNRYSYVYNNPIRFNDPTGHCAGSVDNHDASQAECWEIAQGVADKYGWNLSDISHLDWSYGALLDPNQVTFVGDDNFSFELMNFNGYAVQIDGVDAYQVTAGDKKAIVANEEDSAWLSNFMTSVHQRENAKADAVTVGKIIEQVIITLLRAFGAATLIAVGYALAAFIGTYVLSLAFVGITLGALTIALGAAVAAGTALIPALLTAAALIALGIGIWTIISMLQDYGTSQKEVENATGLAAYNFNTLSNASYVKVKNW